MILLLIKPDNYIGPITRPNPVHRKRIITTQEFAPTITPLATSPPPPIPYDESDGGDNNQPNFEYVRTNSPGKENKTNTLGIVFCSFLTSTGLSFVSHKTDLLDELELGDSAKDIVKGTIDSLTASLGVLSLTSYFGKFPE